MSDFSGSDALIIKNQIRTGQYNLKELNGKSLTSSERLLQFSWMHFAGPDFVSSIEDKDFVYFFFREEAVEFMNCGKVGDIIVLMCARSNIKCWLSFSNVPLIECYQVILDRRNNHQISSKRGQRNEAWKLKTKISDFF